MLTSVDVIAVCRVALAALLTVSVAGKIANRGFDTRELMAGAWDNSRGAGAWIVTAIVGVELSSALMLLASMTAGTGGTLAAAIGLGGAVTIIVARRRGYEGSCGCFGALDRSRAGLTQVLRAASLFLMGTYIAAVADIGRIAPTNLPSVITGVGLAIIWLIVFGGAEAIANVGVTTSRLKAQQVVAGSKGGSRA